MAPAAIFVIFAVFYVRAQYVPAVLMYHSIDERSKQNKLSVSPQSFDNQMRFFKKNRYNVVSLQKLVNMTKSGKPIPRNTVAITFDDGHENNFINAYPVLKRYRLPAIIFVSTEVVGTPGYLTWGQLKEMSDGGLVSIGSHGRTHTSLKSIDDSKELEDQIINSKNILESRLDKKVDFIAYPGGGFNTNIIELTKRGGYLGACATNPGPKYPDNDIYAIKRNKISRTSDNLFVFWIETSGYYTFIKEIRDED